MAMKDAALLMLGNLSSKPGPKLVSLQGWFPGWSVAARGFVSTDAGDITFRSSDGSSVFAFDLNAPGMAVRQVEPKELADIAAHGGMLPSSGGVSIAIDLPSANGKAVGGTLALIEFS